MQLKFCAWLHQLTPFINAFLKFQFFVPGIGLCNDKIGVCFVYSLKILINPGIVFGYRSCTRSTVRLRWKVPSRGWGARCATGEERHEGVGSFHHGHPQPGSHAGPPARRPSPGRVPPERPVAQPAQHPGGRRGRPEGARPGQGEGEGARGWEGEGAGGAGEDYGWQLCQEDVLYAVAPRPGRPEVPSHAATRVASSSPRPSWPVPANAAVFSPRCCPWKVLILQHVFFSIPNSIPVFNLFSVN